MKSVLLLILLAALASAQAPPQPRRQPDPRAAEILKQLQRGEGNLKPGHLAPDFNLKRLRSEDRVRLSSFAGARPVALVFGSYT